MWKRYDDLTQAQHAIIDGMYSGDTLVMGEKNVAEVRRQYAYWCDGDGFVTCRRPTHQIVDWQQTTLY